MDKPSTGFPGGMNRSSPSQRDISTDKPLPLPQQGLSRGIAAERWGTFSGTQAELHKTDLMGCLSPLNPKR